VRLGGLAGLAADGSERTDSVVARWRPDAEVDGFTRVVLRTRGSRAAPRRPRLVRTGVRSLNRG